MCFRIVVSLGDSHNENVDILLQVQQQQQQQQFEIIGG